MNRQILENALECYADPARRQEYFDVFAEDAVVTGYPGVVPGIASIRSYYETFWAAFPDAVVRVDELIDNGDDLGMRFTVTATHTGSYLGIPPSGLHIAIAGIAAMRFHNGKVVQLWGISDSLLLQEQIGAVTSSL